MRRLFQVTILTGLLVAAGTALHGCGSANNDQGMSFTLVGYNAVTTANKCDPTTFVTGIEMPINGGSATETTTNPSAVYLCMTLQNNMSSVGIRIDHVFHQFYIEGASIQPPDSSAPLSIVLGPSAVEATTTASSGISQPPASSLPPGFNVANSATVGFIAIPAEVRSWIALNKNSLPETPFTMSVSHTVTGVTTSGDRLDTNTAALFVVVTPDIIIPPSEGSGSDSDSGSGTTPTPTPTP